MIVAIHQPNYFPWLGYFYKIARADVFVFLDDAQYTKNGYQNRTQIKSPSGAIWLTQPIQHSGHAFQSTQEVTFDSRVEWRAKHLKSLTANYSKSVYGKFMLKCCEAWFEHKKSDLARTNIELITAIASILDLRAQFVSSSSMNIHSNKSNRIIDICQALGATSYLSGKGARAYQTEAHFHAEGIALEYSDFHEEQYPQLWGDFTRGLSVFDALCNVGADATRNLLIGSQGEKRCAL